MTPSCAEQGMLMAVCAVISKA